MSTHTIQTEIEVEMDEDCVYPMIEITFNYGRGHPAYIPPGEFAAIDPSEAAGIELVSAKLLKDDGGLHPDGARVEKWAEAFLESGLGRNYACDCAELDLAAQKHAHLENSRDQ